MSRVNEEESESARQVCRSNVEKLADVYPRAAAILTTRVAALMELTDPSISIAWVTLLDEFGVTLVEEHEKLVLRRVRQLLDTGKVVRT